MDLTAGLVRILHKSGQTAGTGFIVDCTANRILIATCSHVVLSEEAQKSNQLPPSSVEVVFQANNHRCFAQVTTDRAHWRAVYDGDIAMLTVTGGMPIVQPLLLGSSVACKDHDFVSHGYRKFKSFPDGLEAAGKIQGYTSFQPGSAGTPQTALQLLTNQIEDGMSGAPIWDIQARRVVGMANLYWKTDRQVDTHLALAIPIESVRSVCAALQFSDICPYRGLDVFDEHDVEFFHGRQQEIDSLVTSLQQELRFLAVLGPSGSGKSSLIRAGLLPRLRQERFFAGSPLDILVMRPADDPFAQLMSVGLLTTSTDMVEAIKSRIRLAPAQSRLILVIDQFEDVFVSCTASDRNRFIASLAQCLEENITQISFILCMRNDFYSEFVAQAQSLVPWLERATRNVPPTLDEASLRAIIVEPATAIGWRFENDDLIRQIIEDTFGTELLAATGRRVAPCTILPLLESALTELWKTCYADETRQDGVLTTDTYLKIGRVTGALRRWADEAYYSLDDTYQPLARRVLTDLVNLGDEERGIPNSKMRLSKGKLLRHEAELATINKILQHLSQSPDLLTRNAWKGTSRPAEVASATAGLRRRLLVTARDPQSGAETVEIIHDSLIREWTALKEWLHSATRVKLWRRSVDDRFNQWLKNTLGSGLNSPTFRSSGPPGSAHKVSTLQDDSLLLRGEELARAEAWVNDPSADLSDDEVRYIHAGRATEEKENRGKRTMRQILVTAAIVIVVLCTGIGMGLHNAAVQRDLSLSSGLYNKGVEAVADHDLLTAESFFAQSLQLNDRPETRQRILAVRAHGVQLLSRDTTLHGGVLAYSPDGKIAVVHDQSSGLALWDVKRRQLLRRVRAPIDDDSKVVLSKDAIYLAMTLRDRTHHNSAISLVQVICTATQRSVFIVRLPVQEIFCLALSVGGDKLAITYKALTGKDAQAHYKISLWDLKSHLPLCTLSGHTQAVISMAFSADGRLLVSGGADRVLRLWDTGPGPADRSPWHEYWGHEDSILAVAFSPDGRFIASGGSDLAVRLWPVREAGQPLSSATEARRFTAEASTLFVGHEGVINDLAFSPDSHWLLSGGNDHTVRVWDIDSHSEVVKCRTLDPLPRLGRPRYVASVSCVAFTPDGNSISAGTEAGSIYIWSVGRGKEAITLRDADGAVACIAFNHTGRLLAAVGTESRTKIWDVDKQQAAALTFLDKGHTLKTEPGITERALSVAFNPAGDLLSIGGATGSETLWQVGSTWDKPPSSLNIRLTRRRLAGQVTGEVWGNVFSPSGKLLCAASTDHLIHVWDVKTGSLVRCLDAGGYNPIYTVAFSRDGQQLAFADGGKYIQLWDTSNPDARAWKRMPTRYHFPNYSWSVAFGASSTVLVAAVGATIQFMQTHTQQLAQPLDFDDQGTTINHVAYNPVRNLLAFGGEDQTIHLQLPNQPVDVPGSLHLLNLQGHNRPIWWLTFTPDGQRIASAGVDRTIKIWSIDACARVLSASPEQVLIDTQFDKG